MAARLGSLTLLLACAPSAAPLPGSVRLSGGNTDAGRVEVWQAGRWGTICLEGQAQERAAWSLAEAGVVCRELGMRRAVGVMRMANLPEAPRTASGAKCQGSEQRLAECQLLEPEAAGGSGDCADAGALPATAGVRCSNFVPEEQPEVSIDVGNHSEAVLLGLLQGTAHALRCNPEPAPLPADGSRGRRSFECRVVEYTEATCRREEGVCPSARAAAPDPFGPALTAGAYVFEAEAKRRILQASEQRAAALASGVRLFNTGGMHMSALGLKPASSIEGSADEAAAGPNDSDWSALKALYLSPMARIFLDLDASAIGPVAAKANGLGPAAAAIHADLEADGVARIADLGLDLASLRSEALAALSRRDPTDTSSTSGGVVATRAALPSLERWLRENSTVPSAVAAYLGGQVTLHGYKAVHLPATLSAGSYVPTFWHHDRAGRRLKLFIPLHDIDPQEGHPTQVAKGTHDFVYFWHEEFQHTRFTDSYVRSEFGVERLAGKAGGGYIFDTNALHMGTPEGSRERDVVVVEFHHAAKCGLISRTGLNVPCPSGDQRPLNWYTTKNGVA